ncbi:transposase [Roseomonas alkaliterrae]|uniref:Transposase n=1 Tax=Neoroseomonas alkaliterrae TaxID=1452450 RepID=A0A840YD87_9PROT|nr:hypothetical protein [Neoroseomonas alkaliterrae]MBR0676506.1 transposase [Neoroseomonas alkaliterrae]
MAIDQCPDRVGPAATAQRRHPQAEIAEQSADAVLEVLLLPDHRRACCQAGTLLPRAGGLHVNWAEPAHAQQVGETDRAGAISKVGDATTRVALFEAAHVLLTRVAKWSALKAWGVRVAQRRGAKRAKVAVARKLAGVLHRMWVSETDFRYGTPAAAMEG